MGVGCGRPGARGVLAGALASKRCSNTVSTDDAYVNGHVTFVAPRVSGQVSRVLVDDNYRVKKGALLVQLDKEPFAGSSRDQAGRRGGGRGGPGGRPGPGARTGGPGPGQSVPARARHRGRPHPDRQSASQRGDLQEPGRRPWSWRRTTSSGARSSCRAGASARKTSTSGAQAVKVDEAAVDQALQAVYATRVGLGLPAQPPKGHDLSEVPADLDQNFSAVRQALGPVDPERGPARLRPRRRGTRPRSKPSRCSASRTPRAISIASMPP